MLDLFNIAKPQNCDIQTFYGATNALGVGGEKSWIKPRGVSHVYMLLIGRGGDGNGTNGGGSGAVTVWYGAAQHVPDSLIVSPGGAAGTTTTVSFYSKTGLQTLLTAAFGASPGGASSMSANYFTASGFFQSVAGQAGAAGGVSPSTTTFLSGGPGSSIGNSTANYGYSAGSAGGSDAPGYFLTRPIIVGVGPSGSYSGTNAAYGCGGTYTGTGGPGMVLIASW